MTRNAGWHAAHRMEKNATVAQRVRWHQQHAKHCGCRPVPQRFLAEMEKRKRP